VKTITWALAAAVLLAAAVTTVAQNEPQKGIKDADLIGKWKRADIPANDTLEIKKNHSCERNFEGERMSGKWKRNKDGTIVLGFPDVAKDKNPLTVQSCRNGKMATRSKSGLIEKWKK
jgi:hypothetical protein